MVFGFATALVIAGDARRFAGGAGTLARAIAYLVWLALLSGEGGQAPVFYNLPALLAAAATMRLVGRDDAPSIGAGALPMLLVGLAMQIKYTALFEGGCIWGSRCSLWVTVRDSRRDGRLSSLRRGSRSRWPRPSLLGQTTSQSGMAVNSSLPTLFRNGGAFPIPWRRAR